MKYLSVLLVFKFSVDDLCVHKFLFNLIILNASTAGSKASKISSVYGATKAAVRSLARSFTAELKNRKIRVNALSPGPIDTPGLSDAFSSLGMTDDQIKKTLISFVPLGRLDTSDEVAKAVLSQGSNYSLTEGWPKSEEICYKMAND
jgi:NAD(P)-dependent dehydrogenase (short-subunit alcohol dehydrogenase family)